MVEVEVGRGGAGSAGTTKLMMLVILFAMAKTV